MTDTKPALAGAAPQTRALLRPSRTIETFIKGYEKCRLKAFLPTPNDVPTIGWGRTKGVKLGMTQTQGEADADFTADLAERSAALTTMLGGAVTTQAQFDAMVSLMYNIGRAAFAGSSVLTNHKAQHYATAALAFRLWNKQRNRRTGQLEVLAGLTRRRAAEAAIYAGRAA